MNHNTPAFYNSAFNQGLTKLEYALISSSWEPSESDIDIQIKTDRAKNPHNDSYKPKLRSRTEIILDLKIEYHKLLLSKTHV